MMPRVLVVAGSDSGGGAGLQADVKTVTALGGYAMTAVTALTAQDTLGVHGVVPVDPDFVELQLRVVLCDLGADVVKTGMLGSSAVVRAVARALDAWAPGVPLVVDPVMVAKGGAALLDVDAIESLRTLLRRAALVTPNVPEAEALTGLRLRSVGELEGAALALVASGASAALVKGGHLEGDTVYDVLATADGDVQRFEHPRVATTNTHGTGCTLASAIATRVGAGYRLADAVKEARAYVRRAIETAPGFGAGHGPMNHAHPLDVQAVPTRA